MRLVLAAALLALIVPRPLTAQDLEDQLARCAAVESDLRRLACYDQVAESVTPADTMAAANEPTAGYGSWTVRDEINPVDDSESVFVNVASTTGTNTRSEPVYIALQCTSGDTHAVVYWNEYMGSGPTQVTWRFGDGQPETRRWPLSADSRGTFYPRDGQDFIIQLLGADRFVVQASPYSENPITAVFEDLDGINAVATRIGEACQWDR